MRDSDILERDPFGAFCRHTHVARVGARRDGTPLPLEELTFGLKDIYDIAGCKTGFGSPDWLRTHDVADTTSWVAESLLAAGASGRNHQAL